MNDNLKNFIVKLFAVTIAIIIIINFIYNTFLAERMEKIDNLLSILDKDKKEEIKVKLKNEISKNLNKKNILKSEDKELIYKFYLKLKKEFENININ